jgi:hypothetical protein
MCVWLLKYGIECVAVHVKSPQIFVINIYRPSDLPVKYFCDALNRLLKDLTPGIPQIVMGDFNVDLLSRKDDVITRTFSVITKIWGDLTCTATHSIPYLIVVYFGKFLSSVPTKFRRSTFPGNMHNYIWCPYYLPSFMKFCSLVSEKFCW